LNDPFKGEKEPGPFPYSGVWFIDLGRILGL